MNTTTQFCYICMNYTESSLTDNTENLKIKYCVPEIEFNVKENFLLICLSCRQQLNAACLFKDLCIKNLSVNILQLENSGIFYKTCTETLENLPPKTNISISTEVDHTSLTTKYSFTNSTNIHEQNGYQNTKNINKTEMNVDKNCSENKNLNSERIFIDDIKVSVKQETDMSESDENIEEVETSEMQMNIEQVWLESEISKEESAEEFSKIELKCAEAINKLVPPKSSVRYEKEYVLFKEWRKLHKVGKLVNESILLAYFLDASKKSNPSTGWSKYSMLKSMLMVKEAADISKYPKVTTFLKKQSVGHQPNKSKILTRDEVNRFMKESPTEGYLLLKVVVMMGIAGGCRREELYNMAVADVQDTGTQLVVTIPYTKTNTRRVFTVINDCEGINVLEMYRRYISLRPKSFTGKALFIAYRKGKCVGQRVGIHTIGGVPKKIAEFLKLKQPERYTGHCFRRTSATLLANAGADLKG